MDLGSNEHVKWLVTIAFDRSPCICVGPWEEIRV